MIKRILKTFLTFILMSSASLTARDIQSDQEDSLAVQQSIETDDNSVLSVQEIPVDSVQNSDKKPRRQDIEAPIHYEARDIYNDITNKKSVLLGSAVVKYQNMTLKAGMITVDWNNNFMRAEAVPETLWIKEEAAGDSVQTIRLTGMPELTEAGDVMRGEVMTYHFKTRKGRVLRGRTRFEDGFYAGDAIKLVKEKTLNVADASFTTCDNEEDPHFHFWAKKMKIEIDKKVVGKPLVMYIGKVPVAALPFIYFPIQKGRQSGIIIPRYGESFTEGRYLKGLGYYWAASQYWDVKGMVDYFEKSGFLFRGTLNYHLRYKMRGSVSGSMTRKDFDVSGSKDRRWDLVINHTQEISPTMRLTASGRFISYGNFYSDLSGNQQQRLQQEIRSNATLTKNFKGSKSITVNVSQTRDLNTDETTETLPRINFRAGRTPLFRKPDPGPGEKAESRWYHSIFFSYNSEALLQQSKIYNDADSSFTRDKDMGWDHRASLSSSFKMLGVFNVNPSMNYRETWYRKRNSYYLDPVSKTLQSREEEGFFALRTFDFSAGFSTKLYGMFHPRFLNHMTVRHVMTPSVSFSFQPDFSESRWGYTQTVADSLGELQTKDRFSGGLFRSTPGSEVQQMRFSVNNLFQMKTGEGEDEKKFDLLTWNVSSSYNWKAENYKLGSISSSFRADPTKNISLNFRTTHSAYQVDKNGSQIPKLLIDEIDWKHIESIFSHPWLRMTYLNFNLSLRLKGRAASGGGAKSDSTLTDLPEDLPGLASLNTVQGDRFDMDDRVSGFDIPWNLGATFNYSESRSNPNNPTQNFYANVDLEFNLTKRWKITYRAQYDFEEKTFVSQDVVFYRDLHCWEARFVWTPTGMYKRFYFKINVKAPMLKDIKVEKGSGTRGFMTTPVQSWY